MPPRRQVLLPPKVLIGASSDEVSRFRDLVTKCGLQPRKQKDGSLLLLEPLKPQPRLVELVPLQPPGSHQVEASLVKSAVTHTWLRTPPDAKQEFRQMLEEIFTTYPFRVPQPKIEEFEFGLLWDEDPFSRLAAAVDDNPSLRLFALRPTKVLAMRGVLWRALTGIAEDGLTWHDIRQVDGLIEQDPVGGLGSISPSRLLCAPLLAQHQPLAMVFTTIHRVDIVAVSATGGFLRSASRSGWPIGAGTPVLGSEADDGEYVGPLNFPPEHSMQVLNAIVESGDRALDMLTNPLHWIRRETGEIDITERNIAWSSAEFGLGAVSEIGSNWNSPESMWTAFRALGMLEGIWRGAELRTLLNPESIRTYAIPAITNDFIRERFEYIVAAYEKSLKLAYGEPLEQSVDQLAKIRNVLHGTGGKSPKTRAEKLTALRFSGQAQVSRVKDIAVLWWMAMLMSPDSHAPPTNPFRSTGPTQVTK